MFTNHSKTVSINESEEYTSEPNNSTCVFKELNQDSTRKKKTACKNVMKSSEGLTVLICSPKGNNELSVV